MPKIQLKSVYGMVKNGAHTILKIKKRKVPQIFCFFSMVWGDLDVTRGVLSFGHEKQTFYSATVISPTKLRSVRYAQHRPETAPPIVVQCSVQSVINL